MKKFLLLTFFQFTILAAAQACTNSIILFQPMGKCEGKDIQLVASSTAQGNIYSWSCPNPSYNSTSGPFLYIPFSTASDAGTYTLTVTTAQGCTSISTVSVEVSPKPVVSISGQAFACLGTVTQLTANDVSGSYGPYQYSWDDGTTTKKLKIKRNGGVYPHPSCIITNASGCSATNQTAYMIGTLYPTPAEISHSGVTSFCSPQKLELQAPQGNQLCYQWRRNGKNIAGATGNFFNAGSTGNYKLIVTDANGCSDTSELLKITVFERPAGTVTADGPLSFCNGDSVTLSAIPDAGNLYQWRRNGIPVAGATNPNFTVKKAGHYKVEIINQNDCIRLSPLSSVSVSACRDAEEITVNDSNPLSVSAYPNPSAGPFTLNIQSMAGSHLSLQVYDVLGNLVLSKEKISFQGSLVIGSDLSPGIYSARVNQAGVSRVIKLIKN